MELLTPGTRHARARTQGPAVREQFLLFRVGEGFYGLRLGGLRQVLLPDGITGLPNPPYQVCDALTCRGRRVPVIRLGKLFGVPGAEGSATARVLLAQGEGLAIGLLVDEVLGMAEVDPARIAPVPALTTLLDPGLFRGLFSRQDRVVLLVSEDGLGRFDEVGRFYAEAGLRTRPMDNRRPTMRY